MCLSMMKARITKTLPKIVQMVMVKRRRPRRTGINVNIAEGLDNQTMTYSQITSHDAQREENDRKFCQVHLDLYSGEVTRQLSLSLSVRLTIHFLLFLAGQTIVVVIETQNIG